MNNWIWWVGVLVVAVLVDLLAITPLFRYFHRQGKGKLRADRVHGSIIRSMIELLNHGLNFLRQRTTNLWARQKKFLRSMHQEKNEIAPAISEISAYIAVTDLAPTIRDREDLANPELPDHQGIIEPNSPEEAPIQTASSDHFEAVPGIDPDSKNQNSESHNNEKSIMTPAGSKISITVSLSAGQRVQISVESTLKKK